MMWVMLQDTGKGLHQTEERGKASSHAVMRGSNALPGMVHGDPPRETATKKGPFLMISIIGTYLVFSVILIVYGAQV